MRRALKLIALVAAFTFTLVVGIRLGSDPSLLPAKLRPVAGNPDTASFDEAMELIRRDYFRKVDTSRLQDDAISAAVEKLRDRFSVYMDPRQYRIFRTHQNPHFSGVGLDVRATARGLEVVRAFPDSPAEKAGLEPGDVITSVGEVDLKGKKVDNAVGLVQGEAGTKVTLGVLSKDGTSRKVTVTRRRIVVPSVESRTVRAPDGTKVAVVSLSGFVEGAGAQVAKAMGEELGGGAKAVVLDLRGNGGGLLDEASAVGSLFVAKGPIVITKGRNRPREVLRANGEALPAKYPVVVLVDGNTASASEIVAGAVQDTRRGIVVGAPTYGKGVFQEITELPNGGALDITVGEYFLPSGRNLGGGGVRKGAGVRPDIAVAPSAGPKAALGAAIAAAAKRVK